MVFQKDLKLWSKKTFDFAHMMAVSASSNAFVDDLLKVEAKTTRRRLTTGTDLDAGRMLATTTPEIGLQPFGLVCGQFGLLPDHWLFSGF